MNEEIGAKASHGYQQKTMVCNGYLLLKPITEQL